MRRQGEECCHPAGSSCSYTTLKMSFSLSFQIPVLILIIFMVNAQTDNSTIELEKPTTTVKACVHRKTQRFTHSLQTKTTERFNSEC